MIDALLIAGLMFAMILAGIVVYFTAPIIAGLVMLSGAMLVVAVIWIVRMPKRIHDQYAKPFGDYPKVPRAGG